MALNLRDANIVNELALHLYDFLPGSGNQNTAFPIAATRVGIGHFWQGGSKQPAIVALLTSTLERQRHKITDLIQEVVRQSITWRRNKGNPLTREEIAELNRLLAKLNFKIPDLHDADFLDSLPSQDSAPATAQPTQTQIADVTRSKLREDLLQVSQLPPQARGLAFEGFLCDLFEAFALSPRKAFKLAGEQIDGSFKLNNEVYLLEAKWQAPKIGQAELLTFAGKVQSKAEWTRGLFISDSGFTDEGLQAFGNGRRTNIICLDGLDLYHIIEGRLSLIDVLDAKTRRAAETNRAHVPVRELFASVV